jgi:hypothetical protein
MHHHTIDLVIIFSFVIVLCAIGQYFRWKRSKLWHETARLALEKGQPLPQSPLDNASGCAVNPDRRLGTWCDIRCGLIWIAVGVALYYALPAGNNSWAAIPFFVGVAKLLFGVFSLLLSGKPSDQRDRDPSAKK